MYITKPPKVASECPFFSIIKLNREVLIIFKVNYVGYRKNH